MCLFIGSFFFLFGVAALVLKNLDLILDSWSYPEFVVLMLLIVLFIVFFGCAQMIYYANFVQFGLDQLLDAPSRHQSLFVHWVMWADQFACALIVPLAASQLCHVNKFPIILAGCVSMFVFLSFISFLIIIWRKRDLFHTEPGVDNPYKTVIKVLQFARKYKYPLQRSAFTYCDDERPSRLDFCKQRFGGPFTTEQVEDVKTLFRIVLILFAVGTVFVLDLATSVFGFPIIGIHVAHSGHEQWCDASWIIVESGSMKYVISTVFFPIYVCVMFAVKQEKVPKILTRLHIGIFLYLLGVISIFVVDLLGHIYGDPQAAQINSTQCVFSITFEKDLGLKIPTLGLHWASLIPANVLLGVGPLIVFTTALEFISAQSPHSMKGLIVGLFFTINTFFQLLGSLALIPFSLKDIWESESMIEHPPVTNCGFGYLLFVCFIALAGLIVFSVAAKKYKLRERDDKPYDYQYVEDAYLRYLEQQLKYMY